MFDLIASLMAWFYSLVPSVGLAIIMLTLVVMVVLTPVTLKGTRSMIKMQHLGPELKKIQARHKGNREALNQEMMAFYKANNINPMGGCLPLFAQMPVFLVLYQVLRGITRRLSDLGDSVGWVAGRLSVGETLGGAPTDPQAFYPAYIDHGSEIFRDLSNRSEMVFLGMDLSRSATSALSESVVAALPYVLLILVVGISSWVQQRQIRGRNPDAAVNPQMQMMMKVMPFFLPVISFQLDASLVLYFVVSNLYRIAQQSYITRSLYGPNAETTPVVVPEKAKPVKETKKAPSPKKTATTSNDRSVKESSARSGRTTAGNIEKSSQKIDEEPSAQNGSGTRARPNQKPAKPAAPAKKKKTGRRGRKEVADEQTKTDKRPPAARDRGGRTTPVVVPEKAKPVKETKKAPSPKKTSTTSNDRSAKESSARSGRTTAGNIEKSSQKIDEEPSAQNGSGTRARPNQKPAKPAAPAKKKKTGRRGRKEVADEQTKTDKRPPAARDRGGRTTPPGTTRARGSKKKRRK